MKQKNIVKSLILTLGVAGILFFLTISFFKPVEIAGHSMEPTVKDGDRYITQKVTLLFSKPSFDDIVFYKYRESGKAYSLVGRIIATPSDTVEIKDKSILVNGEVVKTTTIDNNPSSLQMKNNQYYILGDNVDNASKDSRNIGPVQLTDIEALLWIKYSG